jgi:hypothetical protein
VDSSGSGQGSLAGCCECGDEPSGSGATELVNCFSLSIYCMFSGVQLDLVLCHFWIFTILYAF